MKKIFAAALMAVGITGFVYACGGMTQIDPPSLQLDAGPADCSITNIDDDMAGTCVLC